MTKPSVATAGAAESAGRIVRHAAADRLFHWVSAICVLVLLGTAFLPIIGFEFGWVTPHWIAGLVLLAAVLFHIVRALFWRSSRTLWLGAADVRDAIAALRATLRRNTETVPKPGKYSVAQKLIHHAFAATVLTTLITGGLMLLRIDMPWWQRNPYVLPDTTWGIVYVLHGLAALLLVTMVMLHGYFALRPEKRLFLRAMLCGWITRDEFKTHHDPQRWQVDR